MFSGPASLLRRARMLGLIDAQYAALSVDDLRLDKTAEGGVAMTWSSPVETGRVMLTGEGSGRKEAI